MPDNLRDMVRATLPPNILSLMDDIEAFASTHISIERNTRPLSETDPNPLAPASSATHTKGTIYLRDIENIDANGILHELLHIHRWWVEQIPQALPIAEKNLPITSNIENALEHQIIIPRETDYGFDPHPYWNEIAQMNWGRYPWDWMDTPAARRQNVLLGRLGLRLVTDQNVIDLAKSCIEQEGLTAEAERFDARIASLITNKPRAISCVFRFLNIPIAEARLVYFDIRNRKRFLRTIPPH